MKRSIMNKILAKESVRAINRRNIEFEEFKKRWGQVDPGVKPCWFAGGFVSHKIRMVVKMGFGFRDRSEESEKGYELIFVGAHDESLDPLVELSERRLSALYRRPTQPRRTATPGASPIPNPVRCILRKATSTV